jgi:hypothetical protein
MPTGLASKDRFGTRVALFGDRAVVGHYYDQSGGSAPSSGSEPSLGAYVVSHTGGQWQGPTAVQGYSAAQSSWFGLGVGVGAQYAVVGAPLVNSGAPGFAGVFAPDADGLWNYCYKFADPEPSTSNPFFGRSVVVRDPLVVVSAPMQQVQSAAGAGAVYVFTHDEAAACNSGWSRSNPIYAPTGDIAENLGFGRMIALDATTMAVGTTKGETGVYLVQRQASWSVCNQIPAPPEVLGTPHTLGAPVQHFGYDIAMDNGLLAVSAVPYPAFTSTAPGQVYLYRVGADCSYLPIATLNQQTAPALALADRFGYSVGVSGATVVVGAPGDRNAGIASGAVYVFAVGADNAVSYRGAIRGAPSFEGQAFGASVAISGSRVLIGATGVDASSVLHGGAHGFEF